MIRRFTNSILRVLAALSGCSEKESVSREEAANMSLEELFSRVENAPTNTYLYSAIATRYIESGDLQNGETYNNKSLSLKADNLDALVNKGYLTFKQGNADEAISIFDSVLKFEPDHAIALTNIATVISLEGDIYKSLPYFEKSHYLYPEDPIIAANLANAYNNLGEYEKRDRCFHIAKKNGYKSIGKMKVIFESFHPIQGEAP